MAAIETAPGKYSEFRDFDRGTNTNKSDDGSMRDTLETGEQI
jgi:hypothetical protein